MKCEKVKKHKLSYTRQGFPSTKTFHFGVDFSIKEKNERTFHHSIKLLDIFITNSLRQ